jgi:hypothetical protein
MNIPNVKYKNSTSIVPTMNKKIKQTRPNVAHFVHSRSGRDSLDDSK